MFKKVPLLFLFFTILFTSCSSHVVSDGNENSTLKFTAAALDDSTEWTGAIEEVTDRSELSHYKGLSKNVGISPELVALSVTADVIRPLYPKIIEGFSLDVSMIDSGCLECIENFCSSLEEGGKGESYFNEGSIYSLVMFFYDYERLHGDEKIVWHAVGEPFCGENLVQCPVRLFFQDDGDNGRRSYSRNYCDIMICARKFDSGYRLISVEMLQPLDSAVSE